MFGVAGVIPGAGSGPRVAVKGISYGTGAALRGAPARGNCSTWHGSPGTGGPGEQVPGPAGHLMPVVIGAAPARGAGPIHGAPPATTTIRAAPARRRSATGRFMASATGSWARRWAERST